MGPSSLTSTTIHDALYPLPIHPTVLLLWLPDATSPQLSYPNIHETPSQTSTLIIYICQPPVTLTTIPFILAHMLAKCVMPGDPWYVSTCSHLLRLKSVFIPSDTPRREILCVLKGPVSAIPFVSQPYYFLEPTLDESLKTIRGSVPILVLGFSHDLLVRLLRYLVPFICRTE